MKITATRDTFERAFIEAGRPHEFTQDGLMALFDHLEWLEKNSGEEYEVDIIGLCCQYNEFATMDEIRQSYNSDYDDVEMLEWLTDIGAIFHDTGIIVERY